MNANRCVTHVGKVGYPSASAAHLAMKYSGRHFARKTRREGKLRVYVCGECGGYFLTHEPKRDERMRLRA